MNGRKDARGINRGRCNFLGCACLCYSVSTDGMKCLNCAHPPGKHQNLTTNISAASNAHGSGVGQFHHATSTTSGGYHNLHSSTGYGNTAGYQVQPTLWSATGGPSHSYASVVASSSTVGGYNHQHTQYAVATGYSNNTCKADDCMNPQHYEHGVGWFDYCSPSCRDRHLLPQENMKLQTDINTFQNGIKSLTSNATVNAPRIERSPVTTYSGYQGTTHHTAAPAHSLVPEVRFNKTAGVKKPGIIISEELFTSGTVKGYLVTGVKCGTLAYNLLEKGELHLLDVIIKMNGQDISSLGKPKVFKEKLKSEKQVHLIMNRDIALPCPKKLLDRASIHKPTHIVALRNTGASHSDFGLTINGSDQKITGVSKDTPARECRLKFGDKVVQYAFANKSNVEDSSIFLYTSDISRAARQRQCIIVAVKRK